MRLTERRETVASRHPQHGENRPLRCTARTGQVLPQEPQAVGYFPRGLPHNTEEESEFFSSDHQQLACRNGFYPGSSEEEKIRQALSLEQVNIPLRNALAQPDEILSNVKLEKISLSMDVKLIKGAVIVRNLAFEKWISVRFTFDWWQTTSEAVAQYSKLIPKYNIDRFEYSIRVPDMTTKIEEKRLLVAIRYTAAGQEMRDNNNGKNYQL